MLNSYSINRNTDSHSQGFICNIPCRLGLWGNEAVSEGKPGVAKYVFCKLNFTIFKSMAETLEY